ncbi:hypothetical protein DLREEDagrD3_27850 [Denitratisoma sp. agr-D3]
MLQIKHRGQAESLFCDLFYEAGMALGVPGYGESDKESHLGVSSAVVDVIHQCEFGDPHFVGGPGVFSFAKKKESVEKIFSRAAPFATELLALLDERNPNFAEKFRAELAAIKDWMLRQSI